MKIPFLSRSFIAITTLVTFGGVHSNLRADDNHTATSGTGSRPVASEAKDPIDVNKPDLVVALDSGNKFINEIQALFNLANSPKQYASLMEIVDEFLKGVDRSRSITVRRYSSSDDQTYIVGIPIMDAASLKAFLNSYKDVGVKNNTIVKDKLYQLSGLVPSFLSFNSAKGEAHIAAKQANAETVPTADKTGLMPGYNLAARLVNDPATLKARGELYDAMVDKSINAMKPNKGESDADFTSRKEKAKQGMMFIKPLLVEAAAIDGGIKAEQTDEANPKLSKLTRVQVDARMSAIPGTQLATQVQKIGSEPSEFAGISQDGSYAKGHINYPLDDNQTKLIQAKLQLARDKAKTTISESGLTPELAEERSQLFGFADDVGTGMTNFGRLSGFLRVSRADNSGPYTVVGGAKVADENTIVNRLRALGPETVTMDSEVVGDVQIHVIKAPKLAAAHPDVIGSDGKIYVGTSEKTLWYATGAGGLDALKTAIAESKKPGDPNLANKALDFKGNVSAVGQIAKRLNLFPDLKSKIGTAPTGDTSSPDATAAVSLSKEGEEAVLNIVLGQGVLRKGGEAAAKFVHEKFE